MSEKLIALVDLEELAEKMNAHLRRALEIASDDVHLGWPAYSAADINSLLLVNLASGDRIPLGGDIHAFIGNELLPYDETGDAVVHYLCLLPYWRKYEALLRDELRQEDIAASVDWEEVGHRVRAFREEMVRQHYFPTHHQFPTVVVSPGDDSDQALQQELQSSLKLGMIEETDNG